MSLWFLLHRDSRHPLPKSGGKMQNNMQAVLDVANATNPPSNRKATGHRWGVISSCGSAAIRDVTREDRAHLTGKSAGITTLSIGHHASHLGRERLQCQSSRISGHSVYEWRSDDHSLAQDICWASSDWSEALSGLFGQSALVCWISSDAWETQGFRPSQAGS